MIKTLSGDMTFPKFGEYNYYYEAVSKSDHILFRVRDIVAVYKKETQILIESGEIYINKISRIDFLSVMIIDTEYLVF